MPVSLDGAFGRPQLPRNLLVDLALNNEFEDLMLAWRQSIKLGAKVVQFLHGDAHMLVSADGASDGPKQLF